MLKRLVVGLAMALAFLVGYGAAADAYPAGGVHGRAEHRGYFTNTLDTYGTNVLPDFPSYGGNAFPTDMDTVDEFISFIKFAKLDLDNNGSGDAQERTGAAFIIHTMLGTGAAGRSRPPTTAQIAEWEARVRYAGSVGRISWFYNFSYNINSFYQGTGSGSNPNDDAFYDENGTSSTIVFRDASNRIVYAIRRQCANPVGNGSIGTVPDNPSFTVSGSSRVSDATVIPGQTVTFTHVLANSGPSNAPNLRWTVYHNSAVRATGGPLTLGVTTGSIANTNSFTIPNNALPNTTYCQYISFTPRTEAGGTGTSAQACATVIADFELTPTVTASTTAAQQNDSISFTYQVFNPGPTPSTTTTCKVVGNEHGPGYNPLPQQDVDRTSDAGYTPPSTNCPRNFFVNTTTQVATETVDVGDLSPGSRICRSLVVDPKNESGGPRASAEACVVIAKTPYVHFVGNDVWAGGGFPAVNPACNTASKITTSAHALRDGSVAGGGVEYGAFALGKITNFGSAGRAIVNPAAASGKMLTFSNVNNANLGFYAAPQHCINDYITTYSGTPITGLGNPVDVNRGSGTWQLNGPLTFHGNVPNGAQQIYLVNGDVTIDGNIRYSNAYANTSEIPSLVIIATGNILLRDNVEDVAGLFVARGTFNTCSNAPGGNLSVNDCNRQLIVNGAVIANTLTLLRTHGADGSNDADRKRPAEIFNFNAEMYLRSALNGSGSNTLRTVDERDLPPRY